ETAGHQHDASCFALRSTLLCGLNEGDGAHTHSDGCKTLQCAEEGHRHGEGCYETSRYLACGHPEAHEHTSDCFDGDGLALCGMIEMDEHRHSARCFVQLPADEGHVHTEECELLSLICEKPEHEHTEACYPAEPEATATPEATIEPEPTAEPEAPVEPEAPAEPEPTLEPEAPIEPEAPAEPEPTAEPEALVEPEATIVPEELLEVKSAETTPVPGVDVPLEPEMEAPAPTEDPEAGLKPEATPEPEVPAEPESSIAPTAEPDGLYICGLQEHLHNAPGANAISLLALFSEDSHTAFCYDDLGSLICPLPEHVHTEDCLAPLTDTVSRAAPTDIGALNGTTASAMQVKYNAETDRYEMEMNMGFAIIPADIVNAGYEYYLDIPNDLQLPGDLIGLDKSFNGYDKDGQLGFTYQFIQIDGHLRLLIHFIPDYVAQYTGVNAKLIEGYVNYKATADKVNDKGEIDLSFGDNLSLTIPARDIEYPANETSTSDLSLTKQGSYQE
ncbi:MAG: hypothetical protein IJ343_08950, partial [Clostridia bacterium]|nr:hypothetical protein [Clostridia bacterium]